MPAQRRGQLGQAGGAQERAHRDHRGDVALGQLADRQEVERLALVAADQRGRDPLVRDARALGRQVDLPEQVHGQQHHPVAGVERDRGAVGAVQGGRAAPLVRSVLDVVDDERAGVQELDQGRQLGRRSLGPAAGQRPAGLDQAAAQSLAGAAQELAGRSEQGALPQLARQDRLAVDRVIAVGGTLAEAARDQLDDGHAAPPPDEWASRARRDSPRGGRPTRMRARSSAPRSRA